MTHLIRILSSKVWSSVKGSYSRPFVEWLLEPDRKARYRQTGRLSAYTGVNWPQLISRQLHRQRVALEGRPLNRPVPAKHFYNTTSVLPAVFPAPPYREAEPSRLLLAVAAFRVAWELRGRDSEAVHGVPAIEYATCVALKHAFFRCRVCRPFYICTFCWWTVMLSKIVDDGLGETVPLIRCPHCLTPTIVGRGSIPVGCTVCTP